MIILLWISSAAPIPPMVDGRAYAFSIVLRSFFPSSMLLCWWYMYQKCRTARPSRSLSGAPAVKLTCWLLPKVRPSCVRVTASDSMRDSISHRRAHCAAYSCLENAGTGSAGPRSQTPPDSTVSVDGMPKPLMLSIMHSMVGMSRSRAQPNRLTMRRMAVASALAVPTDDGPMSCACVGRYMSVRLTSSMVLVAAVLVANSMV